jgi:RNA polymerase sigma-70 factor (ECF subfamily)
MTSATLEGDRSLLAAFRRGDKAALTTVYRLYVDDVVRTLRRGVVVQIDGQRTRLGAGLPDGEIEVLAQETFVRALAPAARQAYDGLRPYGAYIGTIARHLLIDRARARRGAQRVVPLEDAEAEASDDSELLHAPDPTWPIAEKELKEVMADVESGLDGPKRALFRLRYREGLTQRDAADRLGSSLITVRRLDAQLRASLLEAFRSAGHLLEARVGIPTVVRDRSKG